MKPVIDIYFGSPLELASEKEFLDRLVSDLRSRGESAFIFANFHTGKNTLQVDFFVVTSKCACHIELKNYTAPVIGGVDGTWKLIKPDGEFTLDRNKNPYHQALNCKYGISDAMHKMARRDSSLLPPVKNRKFYSFIESVICIFPTVAPGSRISTDNKVRTKSYDDLLKFLLTHERNPGWNRKQWLQFAMYFGLEKAESFETEPCDKKSSDIDSLNQYRSNFADFHGTALHELVKTHVAAESGTLTFDEFLDAIRRGGHILLIGPPGSGKTHLVRHAAINLAGERLPIFLRARDFDGDLSRLIGRGIAHAYPFAASSFLEAAVKTSARVTLIIDGFNECPQDLKQTLVKAMQACFQKFHFPILITSHENELLPKTLCGMTLRMIDLSAEERYAIFNSYLIQKGKFTNLNDLLKPFKTPYELSIAAECASVLNQRLNKTTLFDAFVRRHLASTQSLAVSFRILCEVARVMSERFVNSLTISEFQRLAETIAEEQKVSVAIIDQLLACGLMDSVQGRCAFRHELLGLSFEANAFIRHWQGSGDLAKELARPRNRRLAELVTSSLSNSNQIRDCFFAVADPSLLVLALRGSLGNQAKMIALEDATTLLHSAREDAVNAHPVARACPYLTIDGLVTRSKYEESLLRAIGTVLHDGMFLGDIAELLEAVELHCWQMAKEAAEHDSKEILGYKNGLFQELYVVVPSGRRRFPASLIVQGFKESRWEESNGLFRKKLLERFTNINKQPFGLLYLFAESVRFSHDSDVHQILPAFLKTCWNSKFYHLRLAALDLIGSFAFELRGTALRTELEELIAPLESNHIFLNNSLVETKVAYGILSPQISSEDVLVSFREILANPTDANSRKRAHGELTCIFEEVFEGAYGEAYGNLSTDEKGQLLVMAALGAEPGAFLTDWTLRELLDVGSPEAQIAFQRWATEFFNETWCPQDSVACYLLGIVGCAKYLELPPRLKVLPSNSHCAWQLYGEILFWVFKPGLTDKEMAEKCEPLWVSLITDFKSESVDPLMQMESADWKVKQNDRHPLGELCSRFPNKIRTILEYALSHECLQTIFEDPQGAIFGKRHMDFAIMKLTDVGDVRSASLLERLIDSEEHGKLAVETIRRIRSADRVAVN